MTYKITIEIKSKNLTYDQLKEASRQLSETVEKMGFDHALTCRFNALRKFRVAKNTADISKRIKQVHDDSKFPK